MTLRARLALLGGLWFAGSLSAPRARAAFVPHEVPAIVAAARLEPVAGDASKGDLVADAEDDPEKLPLRAKVKECCGYPVGVHGGFKMTFYWLAYEAEYANERYDADIYTREGFWIGRYPNAFVWELRMEGTGVLRDGRVLNYDGECRYGVGVCFKALDATEHPLGRGVQARPLEPFRSIAVDPRFIPIGSPVWVPELVGLALPDGTRHDGCLRADDQGGGIKRRELDFFVESWLTYKRLATDLWWQDHVTPHLDEPRCEYLRLGGGFQPRERDNEHTDWALLHSKKLRQAQAARQKAKHRPVWAASRKHHAPTARGGKRPTALAMKGGGVGSSRKPGRPR